MSTSMQRDEKKWIQTSVAIVCMILAYILILFFDQIGEWFELESKVPYFALAARVLSVGAAIGTFAAIMIRPDTSSYLREVYAEAVKVVYPDKNETVRATFVIMVLVTIVGTLLWVFDLIANYALSLIR
jgi:preprotein translocase subunit SecE